jgi:hypothetical protein
MGTMTEAPKGKRRWGLIAAAVVVVPVLLFSIYAGAALNWAYSEGERAGVLQKFSHKGWVCKTWEGEIAMTTVPGVAPVMWNFTVRDDRVAAKMSSAVGQRVVLHYKEHRGVPTQCFGETPYFVDSVTIAP